MAETNLTHSETAVALLKANLGYYGKIPEEVETYLLSLLDYAFDRLRIIRNIKLNANK